MARNDGRIEPGQKLAGAISARAWNRAQDAADRVLGVGTGFGAGASQDIMAPYTWVYAKNTTGTTVVRWGVMKITGVEITPTSNATAAATKQFEQMPVLTCGSTGSQACVALEPIENNKIGRVAVAGVVQLKSSDLNKANGACVIWKNDSWALVNIDAVARLGKIESLWSKGYSADVTSINPDGTDASETITFSAMNHFANVFASESSPKKVACVNIGGLWILVAAEC